MDNFHFCFAAFFLFLFGGFGITGGAHRLWAHRSYKAKWPLRLLAAVCQTIAVQVRSAIKKTNYSAVNICCFVTERHL